MNTDVAMAIAVGVLAGGAYLAALAFAVVQIVRSSDLGEVGKALWTVAVVCLPLVAAITWFVAGPRPFDAPIEAAGLHHPALR